jgi:hypothetical protein
VHRRTSPNQWKMKRGSGGDSKTDQARKADERKEKNRRRCGGESNPSALTNRDRAGGAKGIKHTTNDGGSPFLRETQHGWRRRSTKTHRGRRRRRASGRADRKAETLTRGRQMSETEDTTRGGGEKILRGQCSRTRPSRGTSPWRRRCDLGDISDSRTLAPEWRIRAGPGLIAR